MLYFYQLNTICCVLRLYFSCIGDNILAKLTKTKSKPTKELSEYIDINQIIPDELIAHNPINLPFTLIEHNQGFLKHYTIPDDLQEHVRAKQLSRQNNEKIDGHGYDLFTSEKKKTFLKCMIQTYGNKAKACYMSRTHPQTILNHCRQDDCYFDPIFAQLVHFIQTYVLDGHEENVDRQGNNHALIASFYMLNAKRKEIYGNRTTIVHEKPQLALEDRKAKAIDLADFIETKELTSSDEKHD